MTKGRSHSGTLRGLRVSVLVACFAVASCGGGSGGDDAPVIPPSVNAAPSVATAPTSTTSPPAPSASNRDPVIVKTIPDQQVRGGRPLTIDVSQGGSTFMDPDGDPLTYWPFVYAHGGFGTRGPIIAFTAPPSGTVPVRVLVQDGRNGSAEIYFNIVITPNGAPTATRPNLAVMTSAGAALDYDSTQSGTTFTDTDGDALSYQLRLLSPARGLTVVGSRVVGTLTDVGVVTLELTATDVLGAHGTDRFSIAVAAPKPGAPVLPAVPYTYADHELPLPELFASTHKSPAGHFWDPGHATNPATNAGATLGRVLFYDKRLSVTNTHSCGSCHQEANGFAEPLSRSVGVQGVQLTRNSMALGNARFNLNERWFADIRVGTLEELVLMPIQEPIELGNYLPVLERKLAATSFYPRLFEAAFGTREITSERIALALAQFLRALTSYRSRYDEAYLGDLYRAGVLTPQELAGREIFGGQRARCTRCHVQDVQQMRHATSNGLDARITDPGAGGPGRPTGWFRASSLRNVAVSGPYMHDGRFETLRQVIDHYDHGIQDSPALDTTLRESSNGPPLRMKFMEEEKVALEAFLRTLTDYEFLTDPKFADPFL
jgi:cytochrome c peroxidase